MMNEDNNQGGTLIDELTQTMFISDVENGRELKIRPAIIVHQQGNLDMFYLTGTKLLGRPTGQFIPDIPVNMPFVSRKHGMFYVEGQSTRYISLKSTNGTYCNGRKMAAMEEIELHDGDILKICAGNNVQNCGDITIECAFSADRRKTWNEIIQGQRDYLTGLYNRKTFSAWFERVRPLHEADGICLFILDVDHFKQINDSFGHECGDEALVMLAKTLEETLGDVGKACRWGGDEFVGVIFTGINRSMALMDIVRKRVEKTYVNHKFFMTISAGVVDALQMEQNAPLTQLIAKADKMLYAAKKDGRNKVVMCTP